MIYHSFTVNLPRLYPYYPEMGNTFNKLNHTGAEDLGFKIDLAFDLQESEVDPFQDRFAQLMNKYNIADEFWIDLIYINQVIIRELDNDQFYFELDPETSNAIDFLIGYQEIVKEELKSSKKSTTKDPFVIQFKRKSQNGGVNLDYHGSAQLILKLIFKAFKTSFANPTLSLLLEDYKEIPPIEVLKEFQLPPQAKREKFAKYLLQQSAEILSDYFEKYIPKKVHSRKKNLIIFELFYLFDTFQYGGSILNVDASSIRRRNLDIVYSLPFNESKCSQMIKELLKKGKSIT
ncbi:MAG: hypothetical protein B7X86_13910 [Sphingobacteriales bacterium 17-39-43]|nr:MAG: hypothetical protein B7Y24_13415 [Sphingobacteriales bacterium 16-39-50]OZA23036.1 MAG: hypothetical protein B7X86_13910 [Sphingobacteriales bacterium 17-39-43]